MDLTGALLESRLDGGLALQTCERCIRLAAAGPALLALGKLAQELEDRWLGVPRLGAAACACAGPMQALMGSARTLMFFVFWKGARQSTRLGRLGKFWR